MVSGMAGQALGGLDRLHAIWLDLSKLTVNQLGKYKCAEKKIKVS